MDMSIMHGLEHNIQSSWRLPCPKLALTGAEHHRADVFSTNEGQFRPQADVNNILGLSQREYHLAKRVRDVEEQNQILRHQLSISQYQFMSQLSVGNGEPEADPDGPGGEEAEDELGLETTTSSEAKLCRHKVNRLPKCETLQIAIVCSGHQTTRSVVTLLKSILFFRKHPIHFHFVTNNTTQPMLHTLFQTWDLPQVKVSSYLLEAVEEDVSWIPNKHYSGIFGLLKLTLPKILPKTLQKVIVLDTDVILNTDIALLWRFFREFSTPNAIGMVENQSDWYIPGRLWKTHQPWPALGRGFNSGVILMHLERLRLHNWSHMWRLVAEKDLTTYYTTHLADQDVFNAVVKQNPDLVFKLPCQWNLQFSDNSLSQLCYSGEDQVQELNLIHFNSPKKLNVQHKNAEYFRNQFLTFQQYDGSLLRRELYGCKGKLAKKPNEDAKLRQKLLLETMDDDPICYEMTKASTLTYRTHVYFLDYTTPFEIPPNDVTLVAQLSMDRLHIVPSLCQHWPGPISLGLYLSDAEAQQLVDFVQNSVNLRSRTNIGYHVVYKEGNLYPVNYLRNVALENVHTPYVFLSDIDFLPGMNVYQSLLVNIQKYLSNPQGESIAPRALVVPAFETLRYRLDQFPRSKAEVLDLLDLGTLLTFRYHVWTKGHRATNFGKWRTATKPFKANWEPNFEPYVVVPRNVSRYDPRFVGFGWNKVSHIVELHAQGCEFIVLPNVFMIHLPHAPSLDIVRFRSSNNLRSH
eukprot:snap_masked-scaffold12_size759060-processed-gene-6.2 protein:Tk05592 transcript:snap_masked-scaffold12_size759060-processed-gene-6.2-mRNA-1 annotation:"glycosyltransferase-like protein large2"